MIEHLQRYVLPAAYALLPPVMDSPAASALLLAIALQESGGLYRRQARGGPARGFWQFERNGVRALLTHARSEPHLLLATKTLCYVPTVERIHSVLEHNDTLAAVCARLLLWTLPVPLPAREDRVMAWGQYSAAWRPGTPHQENWHAHFDQAWELVEPTRGDPDAA